LSAWLGQLGVSEAVIESTAPYWKPAVAGAGTAPAAASGAGAVLEAPKGRKSDLADVKRLVRRFVAGELMLSFIPEPSQRDWRMVTRGRLQVVSERVQLQNQIESLLEQGRIKLSSVISDLLGDSRRAIQRKLLAQHLGPDWVDR